MWVYDWLVEMMLGYLLLEFKKGPQPIRKDCRKEIRFLRYEYVSLKFRPLLYSSGVLLSVNMEEVIFSGKLFLDMCVCGREISLKSAFEGQLKYQVLICISFCGRGR